MKRNLLILFVLLFCLTGAASAKRCALVIGNSLYREAPLNNPGNDADDIARALDEIGFDPVIKITNATLKQMENALNRFSRQLNIGDIAFFYYAGHAVQIDGLNYLLPIRHQVASQSDVKFKAMNLGMVLGRMQDARTTNVIILDACRDNPLGRGLSRSIKKGLAAVQDKPLGSIIVYATAQGRTAADGEGRNGLFTGAFLNYLRQPDLEINTLFRRVGKDVQKLSDGRQIPWAESSIYDDFYLFPKNGAPVSRPHERYALPPSKTTPQKPDKEIVFWQSIRDSSDPALFDAYIKKFPNGTFYELAIIKKDRLINQQQAASPQRKPVPQAGLSAWYDFQAIKDLSKIGQKIDAMLKKKKTEQIRELKERKQHLSNLKLRYERESMVMSDRMRRQKELEIKMRADELRQSSDEYRHEYSRLEKRLMTLLQKETRKTVYALQQGLKIRFVVEKSQASFNPAAARDLTPGIIKALDKRYEKISLK